MMSDGTSIGAGFWVFIAMWTFFCVLWLVALVPFTLAVMFPERPARRSAQSAAEARCALLALNEKQYPFRVIADSNTELHVQWDVVDASWFERFAKVKLTTTYRERLLLDESRHELRCHEQLRSSSFWLGFDGFKPCFNFWIFYTAGVADIVWSGVAYGIKPGWPPRISQVYRFNLDTIWGKREIERAVRAVGWTFRPVIWWFEATAAGAAWADRLTPAIMRHWGRRQFWGSVYGISWAGLVVTALLFLPPTAGALLPLVLVLGIVAAVHFSVILFWKWLRRANQHDGRARK